MATKKQRVANLLNRILFVDLARAASVDRSLRKEWLRQFMAPKVIIYNYRAFRKSIRRIYDVQLGLDLSPPPDKEEIKKAIKSRAC